VFCWSAGRAGGDRDRLVVAIRLALKPLADDGLARFDRRGRPGQALAPTDPDTELVGRRPRSDDMVRPRSGEHQARAAEAGRGLGRSGPAGRRRRGTRAAHPIAGVQAAPKRCLQQSRRRARRRDRLHLLLVRESGGPASWSTTCSTWLGSTPVSS